MEEFGLGLGLSCLVLSWLISLVSSSCLALGSIEETTLERTKLSTTLALHTDIGLEQSTRQVGKMTREDGEGEGIKGC